MLIKPDCISCILNMATSTIQRTSLNENDKKNLISEIMEIDAMRGLFWERTSPEIIELVWKKIVAAADNPDPLFEEKKNLNQTMMELEPFLRKLIKDSSDPLFTAVNLSIIGNTIDIMMPGGLSQVENSIREKLNSQISEKAFYEFEEQLKKSALIAYFGDNAGEIVTDKLLVEIIQDKYDAEITYITRSIPTLNDVTMEEARFVGMDRIVSVIENGIDGPLPGTIINRCSKQVRELLERADLIISKGGGNFDSLDEEKNIRNISFLLLTKCFPYKMLFDAKMYDPVLVNAFQP